MENRLRGMLMGVAIGDSLGWPSEMKNRDTVLALREKFITGQWDQLIPRFKTRQGYRSGVVGQVTDDTEMSLALGYALLKSPDKNYHWQSALEEYLIWINDRGKDKEYSFPAIG